MKRYKLFSNIALTGLLALGATSCTDWLTLYPQDRVVEENFWEDKNDLEGVRYAAYQQMASTLSKFIIWGDIRSDNYELNPQRSNSMRSYDTYQKIQNAQLDSTMSEYDWGGVYTTINFCNKVISHGAEVLERDPQFTATEWKEMEAEMKALRALNYFYLIRAFKDIPYSTNIINADEEVMDFPLVNQLAVLDTLIMDVRPVAGKARNRFTSSSDTKGLMTNTAIYALLADMYLWRSALREGRGFDALQVESDLDSVIYYGKQSITALQNQNDQSNAGYGMSRTKTDDYGSGLTGAMLIANEDMTAAYKSQTTPSVDSYKAIFSSSGNSDESILEIQFSVSDERKSDFLWSFYGNDEGTHFVVNGNLLATLYAGEKDNDNKDGHLDSRMWYSAQNQLTGSATSLTRPRILKYNQCRFSMKDEKTVTAITNTSDYMNWPVYRLTDVMLMIAEARVCKAKGASAKDEDFAAAEAIVDAIHKRSTVGELVPATPSGSKNNVLREAYLKMVMNERQMELLGEGRRWFDLVRYAERYARYDVSLTEEGKDTADITVYGALNPDPREPQYLDGTRGVRKMVTDFLGKSFPKDEQTLKNRIKNRYGLYSPIYYMEKKANHGAVEQNPVWDREK